MRNETKMTVRKTRSRDFEFNGKSWQLRVRHDLPHLAEISWPGAIKPATFVIESVCDTLAGPDQSGEIGQLKIQKRPDEVELTWQARSERWPFKEYHLICRKDCLVYFYRLSGREASLTDCWYFRSGSLRTDFPWPLIFSPNSDARDKRYYTPGERAAISVNRHLGGAALTPAPFCFGCSGDGGGWASVGIAAKPGEHNFMGFECCDFGFRLTYEGHRHVGSKEVFETPHLVMHFGASTEYEGLEKYVGWLRRHKYVERITSKTPTWWRQPLFCGWGEQVTQVFLRDGVAREKQAPFVNTQRLYERTLAMLEGKGISPGIVVVDEGWQDDQTYHAEGAANPDRWPDLRGFIDGQHRLGRKVILWFGAWCRLGVPTDECSTKDGFPLTVDPSNPKYEARLRRIVRKMISSDAGCYDADGLKLDHINYVPAEATPKSPVRWFNDAEIPPGHGRIKVAGNLWGAEMLFKLLDIMHSELKRAKPDAAMATFAANPYFARLTDLFQLGDMGNPELSISRMMEHRARIARIVEPRWVLYAADWAPKSHDEWRDYLHVMPQLGIPCMHFPTHVTANVPTKNDCSDWRWEPVEERDYNIVAETWAEYRRRNSLPTPGRK